MIISNCHVVENVCSYAMSSNIPPISKDYTIHKAPMAPTLLPQFSAAGNYQTLPFA